MPDKLESYRKKRKQGSTPEPFGGTTSGGGGLFVVQHHAARAEHYDFRLEIEGVLRSWAVPKGPSANPADKRFAALTEDHPLEYAGFEGRIPEGNYGAGSVIVWDRGRWEPEGEPLAELAAGKLAFRLHGYKLRGKWALVRIGNKEKDWLLIKELDAYTSDDSTDSYPADSILSGRSVWQVASGEHDGLGVSDEITSLALRRRPVDAAAVKPMLAKAAEPFSDPAWVYEIKYDGYRLIASHEPGRARLYSRNGHDLTASFPEIADALAALPYEQLVLDGEVVVHDDKGLPSFALLQQRGKLTRKTDIATAAVQLPASFYAFDLLGYDGYDLRQQSLLQRKRWLQTLLPSVGPLRYSDHIAEQGERMYEQMEKLGLEGVIAKKADSAYVGRRSDDWRKIVVARNDDFAIVGYSDPKTGDRGFGALLLAQHDGQDWQYLGRVGSGFSTTQLDEIGSLLRELPPTDPIDKNAHRSDYHWVRPELVAQVRYKELTRSGQLRQPVFERLRTDKKPRQCVLHTDAPPDPVVATANQAADTRKVPLSNQGKVFWPETGQTKGDLVNYYRRIAPWLLPYLADRPVVLTRYPDGIEGKSFFQKDAPDFVPDWIRREVMWSEHAEREVRYFVIDDLDTLLYIINMGTIPLHIWSSRVATLERPDWSILDLDPKEAAFSDVVRIARAIHALCEEIGLPHFAKTSGSTGLHVLIPLGRQLTYEQSRSLAELIALLISRDLPDIATVTRNPARRDGKVYIDFLQNGHGRTLVAPFSVRPLPGAPVSMPLRWHEVRPANDNGRYHIANARRRMAALEADPMHEVIEMQPDLAQALELLGERYRSVD
ncbi:MAG: DNA ligase D [Gammaproteobacteria bacterium]|nr:DNA ligase D [Gammaproteobacteria bacterium]